MVDPQQPPRTGDAERDGAAHRAWSWAREARKATAERDRWIRRMSAQGFSLREVGLAVGMTPPGVARVLKRDATPGPPVADAPKTIPTSVARAHPDCPTRDQLPPDLQVSYDAAVAEWRSGRGKTVPPDDVGAIERHLAELRATPGPVC